LRKAARELPPKYTGFLRRGPSRAQLETQNERWRRSYRLQDLSVRQTGDKATIVARITPVEVSDAVIASGSDKLSRMIREVAMEIINDRAVVQQVHQILEDRSHGRGRSTDEPRVTRSSAAEAAAVLWETREPSWKRKEVLDIGGHLVEEKQLSRRPGNVHTQFERNPFGPGGSYTAITAALTELKQQTGATDAEVMQAMRAVNQGGAVPASISAHPEASSYLARVMRLWWQVEPGRNPASLVTGPMAGEIVASGSGESAEKIEKAVGGVYNPMAPVGAGPAARQAGHLVGVPVPSLARRVSGTPTARAFLAKEEQLMIAYISTLIESKKLVFADDADLRKFIQGELRDYLKKEIGAQMTKAPQP